MARFAAKTWQFDFSTPQLGYSAFHFGICRVLLGLWVTWTIFRLHDLLPDLLLSEGIMQGVYTPPISRFIPEFSRQISIDILFYLSLLGGIFFTLGFWRKLALILLLPFWCIIHIRAFLVPFPADGFLGLLLLSTLLVPSGENGSIFGKKSNWFMPKIMYEFWWYAFLMGIFCSGCLKLESELWVNGQLVEIVLGSFFAKNNFIVATLLGLPAQLLSVVTYGVLLVEILLPLIVLIIPQTRGVFWWSMMILLIGFSLTLQVADVAIGSMLGMLFFLPNKTIFGIRIN